MTQPFIAPASDSPSASDTKKGKLANSFRSRRRKRTLGRTLAVVIVCAVAVTIVARSPSPVGHWDGTEGRSAYLSAYDAAFKALPAPESVLDLRVDYGIVRVYRFAGNGKDSSPFVLLPGRSSGTPVWASNLPGLLKLADVYAIDLLGEPGQSIQDRPISNDADQAAWLNQVLQALPEPSFNLVGLSIGGWTAANLALREPSKLSTLTLIEPVFVFADMPLGTIVRSIPASLPWLPKSWRDGFNSYTAGGAPVKDVPIADMIETGMKHYSLKLPQPTRITEKQPASINIPVLALIAGKSVMHDPAIALATAKRALTNGTVLLYPDASHAINGEYPEKIAADISAFINGRN